MKGGLVQYYQLEDGILGRTMMVGFWDILLNIL